MRFCRRTWGHYLTILDREHFKLKLLRFKSGKACSMQKHDKRSELWMVLGGDGIMDGDGRNTRGVLGGDFILVDCRRWHRFTACKPTWVLEAQFGETCEEMDIERK